VAFVRVLSPESDAEIIAVVAMLEAHEIPCFVQNAGFGGLYPGPQVNALNARAIMVPEEQTAAALELIRGFQAQPSEPDPALDMLKPTNYSEQFTSQDRDAGARSPYENLRVSGTIRSAIIAYGVGVMTVLLARGGGDSSAIPPRQVLYMVLTGLGLQALLLVVRALVARYERAAGMEGHLAPLAVFLFELIADSVTVFLFALATYRGILQYASGI